MDKVAEKNVIDLVEGRKHQLKLGWHILRNASQEELDKRVADRDATERSFFARQSPWNSLDKERVGIASFRDRLQEILADHIRREFPKVKISTSSRDLDNNTLCRLNPRSPRNSLYASGICRLLAGSVKRRPNRVDI